MKFTLDDKEISTEEAKKLCLKHINTKMAMELFMHGASLETNKGILVVIK